ncbi:hypothetical protein [Cerasicoccus arenae]|nr:hypothetical protein [Cerasicoccus arenae]MBK1856685.1 hypothetical protein [Cerasicoccus arenae]
MNWTIFAIRNTTHDHVENGISILFPLFVPLPQWPSATRWELRSARFATRFLLAKGKLFGSYIRYAANPFTLDELLARSSR